MVPGSERGEEIACSGVPPSLSGAIRGLCAAGAGFAEEDGG